MQDTSTTSADNSDSTEESSRLADGVDDDPFFDGDATACADDDQDADNADFDSDDDDYEESLREEMRREEEYTCQFGDRCLCPHFYHHSSECFTVEMAILWAAQDAEERGVKRGE